MDLVLCVMSLHTFKDTVPVLTEARRVLRSGGRLVVVEPDRTGQHFYFDGELREVNTAIRRLARAVDENMVHVSTEQGRPGVSLGPQLGKRMSYCGLKPHLVRIHAVQSAEITTMGQFSDRIAFLAVALARSGELDSQSAPMSEVNGAIDAAEARLGSEAVGLAATVLPTFVAVGLKT